MKMAFLKIPAYAALAAFAFVATPALAGPGGIFVETDDGEGCRSVDEVNLIPNGSRLLIWVNHSSFLLGVPGDVNWILYSKGKKIAEGTAKHRCTTPNGSYSLYGGDDTDPDGPPHSPPLSTPLPTLKLPRGKPNSVTIQVFNGTAKIGRDGFRVY